jgi:hypothetical protein
MFHRLEEFRGQPALRKVGDLPFRAGFNLRFWQNRALGYSTVPLGKRAE